MAATFPTSPINGEYAVVNSITYVYASTSQSWTRVPGSSGGGGGSAVTNGNSNVGIPSTNGNANVTIDGTANVVVWSTTGEYVTGLINATGNITALGNVSGNYLLGNGTYITGLSASKIFNGTSEANIGTSGGNANISIAGTSNVVVVSSAGANISGILGVTGNITGSGYVGTIYTNSIINTGANGTGNIGSSALYFNTVFAKATSAQYADLAEMYQGDQTYMPGTVVEFGGTHEVTITTVESSTRIAGVVSTNPSYIMNSGLNGLNSVPVALTGRVPCQVLGPVRKGDRLVSSMIPGVAQALNEATYRPGCMIGKSLDDWSESSVKLIEVVVGRL
jgi:hypothetical protein